MLEFFMSAGPIASSADHFFFAGFCQLDGPTAPIHPRDIAGVSVAALTAAGHEGKELTISGPAALTASQQVAAIGEAIGRPPEALSESRRCPGRADR